MSGYGTVRIVLGVQLVTRRVVAAADFSRPAYMVHVAAKYRVFVVKHYMKFWCFSHSQDLQMINLRAFQNGKYENILVAWAYLM